MIFAVEPEIIMKIISSLLLGFFIGYFRRGSPAGIRTFTLICLGTALFTVTSIGDLGEGADPSRVISSIVSGIGFLGVGVIWKSKNRLTGLTTAACIWVTAAVGINVGLGEWGVAIASTIAIVGVLLSKKITRRLPPPKKRKRIKK